MGVGLILLLSSFLWPHLLKDDWVWDEMQAQEHASAAANLHQMTHEAAEIQVDERRSEAAKEQAAAELKAAQNRYEGSRQKLERARASRQTATTALRWLGVALLVVGLVGYMAVREEKPRRR
jgi:multidrug resistance efflux pump